MHMKMKPVNDLEKRQHLRHERNHILTEIHDLIRVEEANKVDAVLANVKNKPHDSRRMFQAIKDIKDIQNLTSKKP